MAEAQAALVNCAVTGKEFPSPRALRFVLDPQMQVAFDIKHRLPGEAIWLIPLREVLEEAMQTGLFRRLPAPDPAQIHWPENLAEMVEQQMRTRIVQNMSLARRGGDLIAGFDMVESALNKGGVAVIVQAIDAAPGGKRKLSIPAKIQKIPVFEPIRKDDALRITGKENQSHLALTQGGLARQLIDYCKNLLIYQTETREAYIQKIDHKSVGR